LNWSNLRLVEKSHVAGDRYRPENKKHTGGLVQAKTSNANAVVSFGL
jgi:hypothetical protein